MDCIFCKIANKEIPKEFTYEDEDIMVFPDIHPLKPVHLLIVPKRHLKELLEVDDALLFGKIGQTIQAMVRKFGLTDKGYRVVVNGGGLQDIDHLHVHLTGPMGSPSQKIASNLGLDLYSSLGFTEKEFGDIIKTTHNLIGGVFYGSSKEKTRR